MHKRLISGIMALVMVLLLCAGTSHAAGIIDGTEKETQESESGQASAVPTSDDNDFNNNDTNAIDDNNGNTDNISNTDENDSSVSSDGGQETEDIEEGAPGYLYQAGGFRVLNEDAAGISAFSTGNMDELADEMYTALKNKEQKINVEKYGFYWDSTDDRQQLMGVYYAVVNDHPDLYYVRTGYGVSYKTGSKLITKISPQYFPNIDDEAFRKGVQKAKAAVSDDMDDLQKAIAIHEYIVLNCEYDKERLDNNTIPKESYGAYGVLVNHIAVCQGYALAYKYLMNEYGIECYIVTSDSMNHAWNIVRVGDELYQIDATWDDPTYDRYGLVRHSYLLQSDEKFRTSAANHSSHRDWYVTKGSGVVEVRAGGTQYDDAFWQDVNSPLVFDTSVTKKCYYVSGSQELQGRSCDAGGIGASADTLVKTDTSYSGLVLEGTRLYYNTSKSISSINLSDGDFSDVSSGDAQVHYTLSDGDTDKIYGFTKSGDAIRYVKRATYTAPQKSEYYLVDIPPITYMISYMLDGGKNSDANKTKYDVETADFILEPPTKEHYEFSGWYREPSFRTQVTMIPKGSTGNLVLYAKWVPQAYQITYELDGGVNSPENPSEYHIETDNVVFREPEKEHYDFAGWYEDADCQTQVTMIPKGSAGNLTFYAKWSPRTYQITYEINGGVNSPENPTEYHVETDDIVFAEPEKEHYDFAGWYEDAEYQMPVTTLRKGSGGNRTLYAKWQLRKYTVSYELYGGMNSTANPAEYAETESIQLETPTHEDTHCRFAGWYTDRAFTQQLTEIGQGSSGALTLYAKWEKYYRVSFWGDQDVPILEAEVLEGENAQVPEPEPDAPLGYEFEKWDKDYENVQEDLEIRAVYKPVQYTVTYKLNGATNSKKNPATYTIETEDFRLAAPTHKDTALKFAGWYEDKNYKKRVKAVPKGSTGDMTLYAKWERIPAKEPSDDTAHDEGSGGTEENSVTGDTTTQTTTEDRTLADAGRNESTGENGNPAINENPVINENTGINENTETGENPATNENSGTNADSGTDSASTVITGTVRENAASDQQPDAAGTTPSDTNNSNGNTGSTTQTDVQDNPDSPALDSVLDTQADDSASDTNGIHGGNGWLSTALFIGAAAAFLGAAVWIGTGAWKRRK